MNRIILKVQLSNLTFFSLKLTIIYVDKRFYDNRNNYYINNNYDFILRYSNIYNDLRIENNELILPKSNKYKNGCSTIFNFLSNEDRKNYLKKLYNTLIEWNNNFILFKESSDYENRPRKLLLNGEFWIL